MEPSGYIILANHNKVDPAAVAATGMDCAMTHLRHLPFGFFFMIAVLLSACSAPVVTPSEGAAPAAEANGAIPYIGDRQTSDTPAATTAQAPTIASGEVDAQGIPVGFNEDGRPYRGDPDAPIVMETFSDFQCPYCGRFSRETLPGLLENQISGGEVVMVFYDFPLTSIHPQAAAAANAARCAGERGAAAFWAMHDRLFSDITAWSNGDAKTIFLSYAQELGLADDDFAACLDEDRHGAAVAADQALGQSRGVGSTPTFFLNDQPVIGAYPLDYFNQAIAAVGAGDTLAAAEPEPQAPAVAPTPATIADSDAAGQRGEATAPVTIIEFTDFQCPYCQRHATETMPRLISDMIDSGRVRYVVKDFPLDSIHPQARAAAVAARCAADQDAYWPMHDALFARQAEWSNQEAGAAEVFTTIAGDLGLNTTDFAACLSSGRHDAVVQANQDEGIALGVNGTPAFFIDGFPISGAQPFDLFEYAIGLAEEGTLAQAYVQNEPQATPTPSGPVEVNTAGSYSIGDADAPVVLVEFTDFQCPFCSRHFLETYPQIVTDYVDTGQVRYVFLDFPLSSIHPQAQAAAEAARCAGDQGAYLAMHDALFARQGEWNGRDDAATIFGSFASELGLDGEAFTACLDSGQHAAEVQADLEQGISLGVDGTPAFFLNGRFLSGAQPYDVFRAMIEELLAEG